MCQYNLTLNWEQASVLGTAKRLKLRICPYIYIYHFFFFISFFSWAFSHDKHVYKGVSTQKIAIVGRAYPNKYIDRPVNYALVYTLRVQALCKLLVRVSICRVTHDTDTLETSARPQNLINTQPENTCVILIGFGSRVWAFPFKLEVIEIFVFFLNFLIF